jgi:hypothetical protein
VSIETKDSRTDAPAAETSHRSRRRSARRVDALAVATMAAALVVYLLHGFDGPLARDLAIYSYAGQRFAEGVAPYVGILNRAGPLAHMLPGIGVLGARAVDISDVTGMRVLFMIFSIACVGTCYVVARNVLSSRRAGVVAAFALLAFYGFVTYATGGPREKTPMVLFLLLTLWALGRQRWTTAGVALALATLTWQPVLVAGLAAATAAFIGLGPRERWRAVGRFAVGALVTAGAFAVYFAAVGAFSELVDGFAVINMRYTVSDPIFGRLDDVRNALDRGYGASLWVVAAGLLALPVLLVPRVASPAGAGAGVATRSGTAIRRSPLTSPLLPIVAGAVAMVAWTARDFTDWPDLFPILPFAAIGFAGLVQAIAARLRSPVGDALTYAVVACLLALAVNVSVGTRSDAIDEQRAAVHELLDQLPSDATILSINSPQALVLSGRTNPTRHQTFMRGLDTYVDDTYPGGLAAFADWVASENPTVITVPRRRPPAWLEQTLDRDYRFVGTTRGWAWYVRHPEADDVSLTSDDA